MSNVSRSSWEAICAELFKARHEAFSAGINTSVYVNAYMTMHEHDIGGVLEEMRCGQARLEAQRAAEEARLVAVGKEVATRSPFVQPRRPLNRRASLYRRCGYKSGTEVLFPILDGYLAFASHRCWTIVAE